MGEDGSGPSGRGDERPVPATMGRRERELDALLDHVPDLLSRIGPDGRFQYASRSIVEGFQREVVGLTVEEVGLDGAALETWNAGVKRCFETGERASIDVRIARFAGKTLSLDLQVLLSPVRGADGTIESVVAAARDVTHERGIGRALRQSEQRLRLALTTGALEWFEWELEHDRVEGVLSGLSSAGGDVSGPRFDDVLGRIHPDDRRGFLGAMRSALDADAPLDLELRVRQGDRYRGVRARALEMRDDDGRPCRLLYVEADVHDRREAEAERDALLEAERAARREAERLGRLRDEFLAIVSHELRTPLSAILGWLHILRHGSAESHLSKALDVIERNTRAQERLVSDLLDVGRMLAGKLVLERERVRISDTIAAALDALGPMAYARGVRLIAQHEGTAVVLGDSHRLQQVAWNLIGNAIKFSPQGSAVVVATRSIGAVVELEVIDDGEGLDPRFIAHAFDRFRQGDGLTRGGLGLGLSIVRHVVELHGGTVTAESAGRGRGSTFRVRLPADLEGSAAISPILQIADTPVELPSLAGMRVLLVDDEPDALEVADEVLRRAGARAIVGSSRVALSLLEGDDWDVLVSDLGMPDVDGFRLVRALRAREKGAGHARRPALALTAFVRDEDRDRARLAGYDAHLAKPLDAPLLVRTLARLVDERAR